MLEFGSSRLKFNIVIPLIFRPICVTDLLFDAHDNPFLYNPHAIIVHTRVHLHHGHYFAYGRSRTNKWIMIDEGDCQEVHLKDVLNHQSTDVPFYTRTADFPSNNPFAAFKKSQNPKRSANLQRNNVSKKHLSFRVEFSEDDDETSRMNPSQMDSSTTIISRYPPPGYTAGRIFLESSWFPRWHSQCEVLKFNRVMGNILGATRTSRGWVKWIIFRRRFERNKDESYQSRSNR